MRGRGGWRAIGSVCKSRGTLCCDAAGGVAGSSGLGKLFPALCGATVLQRGAEDGAWLRGFDVVGWVDVGTRRD